MIDAKGYTREQIEKHIAGMDFAKRYALQIEGRLIEGAVADMDELEHLDEHLDAVIAEAAAKTSASAALAEQPITEATAAKVARKLGGNLNKIKRQNIACIAGGSWQALANPQTREAAIAALNEGQGRKIAAA